MTSETFAQYKSNAFMIFAILTVLPSLALQDIVIADEFEDDLAENWVKNDDWRIRNSSQVNLVSPDKGNFLLFELTNDAINERHLHLKQYFQNFNSLQINAEVMLKGVLMSSNKLLFSLRNAQDDHENAFFTQNTTFLVWTNISISTVLPSGQNMSLCIKAVDSVDDGTLAALSRMELVLEGDGQLPTTENTDTTEVFSQTEMYSTDISITTEGEVYSQTNMYSTDVMYSTGVPTDVNSPTNISDGDTSELGPTGAPTDNLMSSTVKNPTEDLETPFPLTTVIAVATLLLLLVIVLLLIVLICKRRTKKDIRKSIAADYALKIEPEPAPKPVTLPSSPSERMYGATKGAIVETVYETEYRRNPLPRVPYANAPSIKRIQLG